MNQKLKGLIVAIDGPAGSGKSTVTHLLAKRLNYEHIDTGALYRAIALKVLRLKINQKDAALIGKIALESKLEFKNSQIYLDGENVASQIRTPEVSMLASSISAYPEVRSALLDLQRKCGENGAVVLEGRDIGTVVFPNAHVKFYLTASLEARARRRQIELEEKGTYLEFEEVKKQVLERDEQDMNRKVAPLRKASDAIEVDTTSMTIEQVVDKLELEVLRREKQYFWKNL
jgi:cytidylate kinase